MKRTTFKRKIETPEALHEKAWRRYLKLLTPLEVLAVDAAWQDARKKFVQRTEFEVEWLQAHPHSGGGAPRFKR